jgi:hypothetical protein
LLNCPMVEASGIGVLEVSTIGRFCASRKPPQSFI